MDVPYVEDASGKRMLIPTQLAAAVMGALLSACVFLTGPEPAWARPIMTPGDAAATTALPVSPVEPQQAAPPPRGHAYLFRGALGPIFSRGMDSLTDQLEHAGIKADVYEFTICRLIAAQAIIDYRRDPVPIVLIGHSMGGLCALTFADILREEDIPVSLVVTIDPAHASPKVPINVERYINVFLSNSVLGGGDVVAMQGYQGHYASFDLSKHEEVTHINIDKMESTISSSSTRSSSSRRHPRRPRARRCRCAMSFRPASRSSCGTAAPDDGPRGRYAAQACRTSPRAGLVADPDQSDGGERTPDSRPARDHPAPPAAGRYRPGEVAAAALERWLTRCKVLRRARPGSFAS